MAFAWFGKLFGIRDPQPWRDLYGATSDSGETVTVDTVQQLSTVYACIGLISRTIAALPVGVYEKKPDGSRVAAPDHPVAKLLKTPSADMDSFEFIEAQIQQLLLWGNSFTEKQGGGDYPVSLGLLNPSQLQVGRDTNGALRFDYNTNGATRRINEKKLFLIRGHYSGGDLGASPIQYGANSFGQALSGDKVASKIFLNGLQGNGFIKIAQSIKDEKQRQQFIDIWITPLMGAKNAGKIGVLENGMEWVEASTKAVDQEILSSRKFSVEEICRWFGVPPVMIGHAGEGQTMWGSGIEQINLAFLIHTIRPWLRRYQAAASKRLFTPVDSTKFYLDFNVDGLLEADSAGRAAMYSSLTQNGIMTRNEVRAKENLPKSTQKGADDLTAQTSLAPLDKLGEIKQSSATQNTNPTERRNGE